MKNLLLITLTVFGFLVILEACQHKTEIVNPTTKPTDTTGNNNPTPCDSNIVYFDKDILPILNSNCAMSGCHDAGTAAEGIILNSYTNVMATGRITPFNPGKSELYEVITETKPDKIMPPPPAAKLSATQIALIAKWINQGAKKVDCNSSSCDTLNVTYTKQVSKLLTANCVGCHNAAKPSGSVLLDTYDNAKQFTLNGNVVGSVLGGTMPKGATPLNACNKRILQLWAANACPQ